MARPIKSSGGQHSAPKAPSKNVKGHRFNGPAPTEAELAGIRSRSAAAHGGKSLGEPNVLRTWQNNRRRTNASAAKAKAPAHERHDTLPTKTGRAVVRGTPPPKRTAPKAGTSRPAVAPHVGAVTRKAVAPKATRPAKVMTLKPPKVPTMTRAPQQRFAIPAGEKPVRLDAAARGKVAPPGFKLPTPPRNKTRKVSQ